MGITDRLREYLSFKGISTIKEFSTFVGFSHQTASNYWKGLRVPNHIALEKITRSFTELNISWLLTGDGEMLEKSGQSESSQVNYKELYEDMKFISSEKEKLIERLEKENNQLRIQLKRDAG